MSDAAVNRQLSDCAAWIQRDEVKGLLLLCGQSYSPVLWLMRAGGNSPGLPSATLSWRLGFYPRCLNHDRLSWPIFGADYT